MADNSYLDMSDEDMLKAGPPAEDEQVVEKDDVDEQQDDAPDTVDESDDASKKEDAPEQDQDDESDGDDATGDSPGAEETDDEKEEVEDEQEDPEPKAKTKAKDEPKEDAAKPKDKTDEAKPDEGATVVDYKAEYERLLTPFKANGRELSVKSVDDAITLMQMGANYNKKMSALKPNLKLMKMLENHGLLVEDKLSFLIDLDKKNPNAINKLLKDSGIDPMDLDAEKASEYKQSTNTVDDHEIELDTVLDDLQGSPAYNRTLEIVSTKWDGASKQVIAKAPQLLKVINDHVASGIYDIIVKELESERVFGRLNGLSDIEAYRQVGDAIQARGGFNQLDQGSSPTQGQSTAKPVVVAPKPKIVDEGKLRDKRRAASSTKPVGSGSSAKDFNPLSMSDEEFNKQVQSNFL